MANGVLVFAEQREGAAKRAGLEAVSQARRMSDAGLGSAVAVVIGSGVAEAAKQAAGAGAQRVLVADHADLSLYAPGAYAGALAEAYGALSPALVILPASAMGKDLAARLAARLGLPLVPDVVEISAASGKLSGRRPVYSGKAIATFECPLPCVVTLRPNVFPAAPGQSGSVPIEPLAYAPSPADLRSRVAEMRAAERKELDVAEAQIIVSGGRGLKDPANFSLIRDLADALGGAVGASRAVVDAGWIGHSHQVGQTGKVVSPPLYIAVGISGAIQHLAGMSTSRVIVAIDKNPEAPMLKVATYGIVGDLFEIVPLFTEEVRRIKGR